MSENVVPAAAAPVRGRPPAILRFLRGVAVFIVVLILLVGGLLAFCALDRRPVLSVVPRDFSVYVGTEDLFGTLEPMLDLQAADVALVSSPELRKFRAAFMDLRSSPLRRNPAVRIAGARRVNAALYPDGSFLAVVDMSWLSLATRPLEFLFRNVPAVQALLARNGADVRFVDDGVFPHFVLKGVDDKGAETETFFMPSKNLLCASSSLDTLMISLGAENDFAWTAEQRGILEGSSDGIRIVADARKLAGSVAGGDEILSALGALLPEDGLSVVSVRLSDSDILVDCSLPVSAGGGVPPALASMLSRPSTVPSVLSKMGDVVQYYTVLNVGSLSELKDALFPLLPGKDAESAWGKANMACRLAFGMDVAELAFSWTGSEFAAFGIENQNDPVFALKIRDEKKRREVFDKFVSSIFISDDNSLILGGVRLPRLKLPSFLGGLLSLFGVEIPSPYYMVLDDFVYFSESPESLSAVFTSQDSGSPLMKSEGWKAVSTRQSNDSSVTLFYDLERSVPFFIRKNAAFADVFRLYSTGRFDARLSGGALSLVLQASARKGGLLRAVPGFPIPVGRADPASLVAAGGDSPRAVFWTAGGSVSALDVSSLEVKSVEDVGRCALATAVGAGSGVLWAASESGNVYLCDDRLAPVKGFPVSLGERTAGAGAGITAVEGGLLVPLEYGRIAFVDSEGHSALVEGPEVSLKAAPSVLGRTGAVYNKEFFGGVYLLDLKSLAFVNADSPLSVDGIGFGAPAVAEEGGRTYTAFVTQAGELTIWEDGGSDPAVRRQLEGTFTGCLAAGDGCFYALSTDAVLHRITVGGEELCVRVPHATARSAHIRVVNVGGREGVLVNADSNVIYAFGPDLELLAGFPLTGSGTPALIDVNGDGSEELVAVTLDGKLVAWKMR